VKHPGSIDITVVGLATVVALLFGLTAAVLLRKQDRQRVGLTSSTSVDHNLPLV